MTRRRKNPSDVLSWATLGLLGVGAYLIYRFFNSPNPNNPVNTVSQAIANLFPGTSPTVVPQGSVLLPTGATVPVSSLTLVGTPGASGPMTMTDGTTNYSISPGASAGSYVATPLSGLGAMRRKRRR